MRYINFFRNSILKGIVGTLHFTQLYYIGCTPGRIKNTYLYDADHRLKEATNYMYTPTRVKDNYSSHYLYDDAGNITHLSRNGFLGLDANQEPLYGLIDDLTYIYDLDFYLTDVVNNITTASEDFGFKGAASSYTYDLKGNLTTSSLNNLSMLQYNPINLPGVVSSDFGTQTTHYSISGSKMLTVDQYIDPPTGHPTDITRLYFMGLELEYEGVGNFSSNFTPKAYNFGDGRLLFDGSNFRKQYHLHDHLGNVVVVFEDKNNDGELEETTTTQTNEVPYRYHYYPFGMTWDLAGPATIYLPPNYFDENRYQYNGKEYKTIAQMLDYGWRWYDPVIGRWNGVDPLAEKYTSISPYAYVANNPIIFIDPDGMEIIIPFRGTFTNKDQQRGFAAQVVAGLNAYSNDRYVFNETTNRIQIAERGTQNTDRDFSANTDRIAFVIGNDKPNTIIPATRGSGAEPKFVGAASDPEFGSESTVHWNPMGKSEDPKRTLHHEIIHVNFSNKGERLEGDSNVPIPENVNSFFGEIKFLPKEELRARRIENEQIRKPAGQDPRPIE
nr:RHS repeat-associated core domain-containing protein [Saprospiraceae bacterium]